MFTPMMLFKPSTTTTLTTGLAHYWKMTSSNVDDVGLTCTDYNMSYSTSYGKIGGGASFNGTSSYINMGSSTSSSIFSTEGAKTRSISIWLYPTQYTVNPTIVGLRKEGEISLKHINAGSSKVYCYMYAKVGTTYQEWYTKSVDINKWTNFVITFDLTNRVCKTYINGEYSRYSGSDTIQAGTISAGNSQQRIGANIQGTPGEFYTGYLDEVGMWNKILTPSEIQELYWSGVGNQNPFTP